MPSKNPLQEGILAGRATQPGVKEDYVKKLEEFQNFARSWKLADEPDGKSGAAVKFDKALETFMDRRYLDGYQAEYGDKLRSAVQAKWPQFAAKGDRKLPNSDRCLKGWHKVAPSRGRDPMPEEVCCAIAAQMLVNGCPAYHSRPSDISLEMALFLFLSFSTYARPSEIYGLKPTDVTRPTGSLPHPCIRVGIFESGVPTKNGVFDHSVELDDTRWPWLAKTMLGRRVLCQKEGRPRIFSFSAKDYTMEFKKCLSQLKIKVALVPYQARHGGSSRDSALKLRSKEDIRRRGNWLSTNMDRRYAKPAMIQSALEESPDRVRQCGIDSFRPVGDVFLGGSMRELRVAVNSASSTPMGAPAGSQLKCRPAAA